ncbi:hypothetical protein ACFQQB_50525 [Nonomuraea rubra]
MPRRSPEGVSTTTGPFVLVCVTNTVGVPGAAVLVASWTGGGFPLVTAGGRTVEPALPEDRTAGGLPGSSEPPPTLSPSPPEAAMTVMAAIETVARAAKLACES